MSCELKSVIVGRDLHVWECSKMLNAGGQSHEGLEENIQQATR